MSMANTTGVYPVYENQFKIDKTAALQVLKQIPHRPESSARQ